MSTRRQASPRPWWKRLFGAVHVLFNLSLLLGLLAQAGLLYLLWEDGELPIPGFVIDRLEQEAAKHGVELEIDSMKFDLRGIVLLRDVKVSLPGYHEPIAEVGLIMVDFPPWALLDRHLLPNEVWMSNCDLYCPSVLSPTGTREPVAQDLFTEVAIRGRRLDLDRLILRVAGLDIRINGSLPVETLRHMVSDPQEKDLSDEERNRKIAARYANFCRDVLKSQLWIERFTDPRVQVAVTPIEDRARLRVDFQALSFNLGEGMEGKRLTACAVVSGRDRESLRLRAAWARFRGLDWSEKVTAELAQLQAIIPRGGLAKAPKAFYVAAVDVKGLNLALDTVTGNLGFNDKHHPEGVLHLQSGQNWLTVDGHMNDEQKTAALDVTALWDPLDLLKISFLEGKVETPPDIDCTARPYWGGHVELGEGYRFDRADVTVDFGQTRYRTLDLTAAYASATITPKSVQVTEAMLATKTYTVRGSYEENLETRDYRFLLRGHVNPLEIAFLIDADWWKPLWSDFDFHGVMPYSNIDIQGTYGKGNKGKTFFGFNEFQNFTYQGTDIDTFTAMLWREPARIILYEMDGVGRTGGFDAAIQFNYTPDGHTRTSLGFAAATTLPLKQAAALAGKEAVEYVDDFKTTRAPRVQVNGLTIDTPEGQDNELYLKLIADMDSETIYDGYVFDHLYFEGLKKPDVLQLRNIRFGLAGGEGKGQADIAVAEPGNRDEMALKLDVIGASYVRLQNAVPLLGSETGDEDKEPEPDPKAKKSAKANGRELALIDFALNAQGETGDVSTFRGFGSIGIRDALLGQFHIFGGLSRAVQAIGLNLGTVDFTKGEAPFTLGQGQAYFPSVVISGPTARVDANGSMTLDNNGLNFYLSLYPLGGLDVPVISNIFSAINPLSDVIEARLRGTVSEPDWNVDFRPLGILMGQKKVSNETGVELPKDYDPFKNLEPSTKPKNSSRSGSQNPRSRIATPKRK